MKIKKWLEDYSVGLSATIVLLVLIANTILSYFNFRIVVQASEQVKEQYETILQTNRVAKLIVDAETGQRGYIITGDPKYLQPYEKALPVIDEHLSLLRQRMVGLPEQEERVDEIIMHIDFKLNEMKNILILRDTLGLNAAREQIMKDLGRKHMDNVRELIQEVNEYERNELLFYDHRVDESRARALVMLITGSIVMLGFSGGAFVFIRQQMKYRTTMGQLLRQSNQELEQRVQHRTEALLATNINLQQEIEVRKKLEDQAVKFAAVLQVSNKELEQFASVASHDLQEPLRKIQAFSDRLVSKYREVLDDKGKEYIDRIQFSAGRMRHLIEDLLKYSRVSTKGKPFTPVDLNEVVKGVLADLEIRIQETNATITVDPLPTIEADELQMQQLFLNLMGNCLKFHRPGVAPQLKVSCRTSASGNLGDDLYCELVFTDNGIGFENQYADRIFQLFQRLHGRNEYEGTGLGLAICKKIVDRHGGTITAQGIPGTGATFIVRLPITHPLSAGKE